MQLSGHEMPSQSKSTSKVDCTKAFRWQRERTPPVPIPNTVVKTFIADNTRRVASREDRSLPNLYLPKKRLRLISKSLLLYSLTNLPSEKTPQGCFHSVSFASSTTELGRRSLPNLYLGRKPEWKMNPICWILGSFVIVDKRRKSLPDKLYRSKRDLD